jgi:hypothetical protein
MFLSGYVCVPSARAAVEMPPLLREYCFDCHGEGSKKGGVALDNAHPTLESERAMWFAVWKNLDAEIMPPVDKPRPSAEERRQLRDWVTYTALKLDPANPDPGRIIIRRLNREEYRNTIKDLTGVDYAVQDQFPPDDTGYGFDTIGAVLNLSPIHLEKYLSAAQTIVTRAFKSDSSISKQLVPCGPPPPPGEARNLYMRELIRAFAERAFRRPVDSATLDKLTALASSEDSFAQGLHTGFSAVLSAPRFLFRSETQPATAKKGASVPIDEYALASRLSYFLWSSTPDSTLLTLAENGELRRQLPIQIERMIKDPRSLRFTRNFVGQWLQTRDAETIAIQPRVILGIHKGEEGDKLFSARLREAMRLETETFFHHLLQENLPAEELLSAKYSFLNQTLASFYGIQGVKGADMRKVELPQHSHRQGILSHGSFLVVTSNPTRTSPVKRGQFILDNLLGAPAPPPPPNIPPLENLKQGAKLSMRELMALHRSDALCSSCHQRMDPLGLALENFNAIGMYRETINNQSVDASGQLITGEKFNSLEELVGILSTTRKHDFYRCLVEKLLTFAIGRGMEPSDIPTLGAILTRMETSQGRLGDLVKAIVECVPFQNMRGEDAIISAR